MPSVALFKGPFHVMEYADPEVLTFGGRDGRGAPVREIYDEPWWADAQAAMDDVYRSGEIITLARPLGILVLGPRRDAHGRVYGVASWFRLSPQPVAAPPRSKLPLSLIVEGLAGVALVLQGLP